MVRALALTLLLCACGPRFVERPTQVSFDPASRDFWALPFPSDLRRQADGTFNLERYPGLRTALSDMWIHVADERLTNGWGVSPGVFFTTSAALDPATLPKTPAEAMAESSPAYLVDIDPASPEQGKRYPLEVSFFGPAQTGQPENLLALVPSYGHSRRPLTTYAAVLTDALLDTTGQPLGRSRAFHDAWEGDRSAADEHLAPLRAFLDGRKVDRSHVIAAAVFRTFDPSTTLVKLAEWIEQQPAPQVVGAWEPRETYDGYQWFANRYTVPKIQSGDRPGNGTIQWSDGGDPIVSGSQTVRLSLTIPFGAMPDGGWPVLLYAHGSGGEYREAIDRGPLPQVAMRHDLPEPDAGTGPAQFLAKRGIATVAFDFPLHGDRGDPPDTTGLKLYDLFGDISKTIDNMQVGAMEVVYLTRLLGSIELDATLSPNLNAGSAADGKVRLDVSRLSAMGQSMGTTFLIPISTVDPRIKACVFSGAGGSLIDIANNGLEPLTLAPNVELLLGFPLDQHIHPAHPLLHLFQHLWDLTDPQAKARHVAAEPRPGHLAHPFLMFAGFRDGYFSPHAQSAVGVPLGATMVGEPVEPILEANLELAGRAKVMGPLSANLNGVTAGVAPYAAPFTLGHYVAFDDADARAQYLCFVEKVGTPEGPRIIARGSACP